MTHVRILMPCYERPELATMLALLAETHDLRDHGIAWSIDVKHGIYPTALACNHGVHHALLGTRTSWTSPDAPKDVTHVLIWGADNYPRSTGAIRKLLSANRDVVGSTIRCKGDTVRLGFQPLDTLSPIEGDFMRVRRCGSGFMLLTRSILERAAAARPSFVSHYPGDEGRPLAEVFRDDIHPVTGEWTPEDYFFCDLVTSLGGEVWMETATKHGHIGKKDFVT